MKKIQVHVQTLPDLIRIMVSDNGRGWPKENRNRLLEPYMTTRSKGTGLGLAIVSKIVEQHNGSIELKDAPVDENGNVGACFCFTLPYLVDTPSRSFEGQESATQISMKKVADV